jgi:very-short-patch-repair endonuclease
MSPRAIVLDRDPFEEPEPKRPKRRLTELERLHLRARREHLEITLLAHLRAVGLPLPERNWRFHPERQWALDFAWPDRRLAVEVEGGTWSDGRHVRGAGYEQDAIKYSEASILGWLLVRVTGAMVRDGRALDLIERAWRARGAG